tara:strand:- start:24 stop:575 length:552 start_codon:yes stop_codon:yes gene_type:complete
MKLTKPLYEHCHDGSHNYLVTTNKQDFYHFRSEHTNENGGHCFVRRFSDEPSDYGTSMMLDPDRPEIALALLVAVKKGYMTYADVAEAGWHDQKLPEGADAINVRQWGKVLKDNRCSIDVDSIDDIAEVVEAVSDMCMFVEGPWRNGNSAKPHNMHYRLAMENLSQANTQLLLADYWYKNSSK